MMKAALPFLCLGMLVAACQGNRVLVEPAEHQRGIAASLQYIHGANDTVRRAVNTGDYIVVEREAGELVYHYKGKSYPDAASITPDRRVGFVYFHALFKHETEMAVLEELRARGVDVPYFVWNHNGLGNLVSPASLPGKRI